MPNSTRTAFLNTRRVSQVAVSETATSSKWSALCRYGAYCFRMVENNLTLHRRGVARLKCCGDSRWEKRVRKKNRTSAKLSRVCGLYSLRDQDMTISCPGSIPNSRRSFGCWVYKEDLPSSLRCGGAGSVVVGWYAMGLLVDKAINYAPTQELMNAASRYGLQVIGPCRYSYSVPTGIRSLQRG